MSAIPELNILFDYITVTFPVDSQEKNFKEVYTNDWKSIFQNKHFIAFANFLNINPFKYADKGRIPRYEKLLVYGVNFYFKVNGSMDSLGRITHSLELKGEGCREAERNDLNWFEMFKYIHKHDLNVSTLHIANDIFIKKYFTIEDLLRKSLKGDYISTLKKFYYIDGRKNSDKTGISLYFGSRESDQINIYDKKNERYYRGYDVNTNYWLRIEIRLKRKTRDFIRLLIVKGMEALPELYLSVLSGFIEFKTSTGATRMSNRKMWREWGRFLKDIPKIKLQNQARIESSLTEKFNHYVRSYGSFQDLYFHAVLDEQERLDMREYIHNEKSIKYDNHTLNKVNEARLEMGKKPFVNIEEMTNHIKGNF